MKTLIVPVLLCNLAACSSDGSSPILAEADAGPTTDEVTYYQDVEPILYTHCVGCHSEGGIGPFVLNTAEAATSAASAIALATADRIMPPWPPGEASKALKHDRSLSAEQIQTISEWAAAGAPLGDPENPGLRIEPEVVDIGETDVRFDIGVDYVADESVDDDYRCFLVDPKITNLQYVTGYRVIPGNERTVHHVIAAAYSADSLASLQELDGRSPDRAGWPCFSGLVPDDVEARPVGSFGSWVPGVSAVAYPEGTGRPLVPGALAVIQVHYNLAGGLDPDRTVIELATEPSSTPLTRLGGVGLVNRDLNITAGSERVEFSQSLTARQWLESRGGQVPADGDFYILGGGLHAHLLATEMSLLLNDDPIIDIPRWDFHWQGGYTLEDAVRVTLDDVLTIRCVYNNSDAFRATQGLGPSVPVAFGDGTEDEMCIGSFQAVDELP